MTGQKIGYIRVSSVDQNTIRQLDGISLDKVFTEKLSGKSIERPILLECITYIRSGDTLYVHSIDRLARNAKDLLNLVEQLLIKQVTIIFVKNNLTFSSDWIAPTFKESFNHERIRRWQKPNHNTPPKSKNAPFAWC